VSRVLRALLLASVAFCGSGCELIVYSDHLVNENRHSGFVTKPASAMGIVGFVLGIPFDLLALPITYTVYSSQKARYPDTADPLSTLLFPSFVLWRTGVILVGAPLDLIEYVTYRAWTSPPDEEEPAKRGTGFGIQPVDRAPKPLPETRPGRT
jgi:hypothetical protein